MADQMGARVIVCPVCGTPTRVIPEVVWLCCRRCATPLVSPRELVPVNAEKV